MKQNYLKQFLKMSKYALYGMLLQSLAYSFLLAETSTAQKSLSEVSVKIDMQNASLAEVLENIAEQSGFAFVHDGKKVNLNKPIDLKVKGSLQEALVLVSRSSNLQFKRINDNIFVSKKDKHQPSAVQEVVMADDIRIAGKITDENGQGLPGASIIVKGTTTGTTTDLEGNYTLNAPENGVLVISFVGYSSVEVPILGKSTIDMQMKPDAEQLDEIVVVGYSSQTRETMATSVSKLDTRILQTSTRSNAATALQGTVPGLRVTNTTGQPGATPSMVLRGGTNFDGSGSPLILVDGVPSSFYGLNADDIESIEVLKDAAATAIYGARSADGVILITTKQGKAGKTNFKYSHRYSINKERETPDYVGAADFIKYNRQAVAYYNEASGRNNFDASFLNGATAFGTGNNTTDSPFTTQYLTDDNRYLLNQPGWQTIPDPLDPSKEILFMENDYGDLIYQKAFTKDHYVSMDGGNDKATYYIGLGALDNDGLALGSGFKRYSGKVSASYKVLDNFKVSSIVNYIHSNLSLSPLGSNNTIFRRFAGQANTSRIYNNNPDGTLSNELNPGTNHGFGNPLYYQDKFRRKNLEQRLSVGVNMDWDVFSDLRLSVRASHFTINNHNESFNRAYLTGGRLNSTRNASASLSRTLRNQVTTLANYEKTIGENHNFNVLVGTEYYADNSFGFSAGTRNSPTDIIETMNAGSEANGVPTSSESEYRILSTFGSLDYNYDTRYVAKFTFRRDGTSRLGNNKYGFFPGASVAWNLHKESFFEGSKVSSIANKIKPRVSYGVNGKVESLGNYQVFGAYGQQGTYDGQTGYANTGLPTLDLRWERSTSLNMGVDLGFLDGKINVTADYFIRDVKDKIAGLTLPIWTGFSSVTTNNGTLRNKGLELQINANVINKPDMHWNVGATFYRVRNFVVKLPENDNELNRQGGTQIYDPASDTLIWVGGLQEGQRVGTDIVVAYEQDYIYPDQAAVDEHADRVDELLRGDRKRYPGDVAWVDRNGDNIINFQDRKVIGRTTPDVTGAFTSNFTFKGFNLYVKTDFAFGHLIRNELREKGLKQTQGNLNAFTELLDSWTPENRNTDVPRMVFVDYQNNYGRGSTRMWEKGDYLALREVSLSYDFNSEMLKNKVKGLKVYVTASNLHYFKNTSTDTPELGGYRFGDFPMPRTYTFGIDVTF